MDRYADDIFEIIVAYVEEMCADVDHGPIGRASMLSPLGLDSIGRALLIEKLRETLELSVSSFEFYQANNLGELAEIFAEKVREKELMLTLRDSQGLASA